MSINLKASTVAERVIAANHTAMAPDTVILGNILSTPGGRAHHVLFVIDYDVLQVRVCLFKAGDPAKYAIGSVHNSMVNDAV
jgi:hypothetical protein